MRLLLVGLGAGGSGPADLMNDRSDAFLSTDQTEFIAGRRPRAHISQDAQGAQRVDPAVWGIAPPQDRSRPAGPVWAHIPHRVGWLLMPLPRRRMGLSSDEERARSRRGRRQVRFWKTISYSGELLLLLFNPTVLLLFNLGRVPRLLETRRDLS